ncbi:MAG: hypothetical protein QG614_613 [Patescibacteria group bacterium]|nr:hypothetical protein [Patescibacteria group bacterium]
MLPRQNRIKTEEFKHLKNGVNKIAPIFNGKEYSLNEKDSSKLSVIISKKHLKKANKRNALKRKICYAYMQILKNNSKYKKHLLIYYKIKDVNQKLPTYKDIKNNLEQIIK